MLLIDTIYVNNGGGKILLEYLLEKILEKKLNVNCFVLIDKRCDLNQNLISNFNHKVIDSRKFSRFLFYLKNKNVFSKIFCFGNIPPFFKFKNQSVITYFHQPNFVDDINLNIGSFHFFIKVAYLKLIIKNTDLVIVQTDNMKAKFVKKFNFKKNLVLKIPFFPEVLISEKQKEYLFFYPSLGYPHKNHFRLLDAFSKFYEQNKKGQLILTVPPDFKKLYAKINLLIKKKYPILNLGFLPRTELFEYYARSEYLIFPSLNESFGLGIIEGVLCDCKLIGSNLEYIKSISTPSITFEALSEKSILEALQKTITDKTIKKTQLLLKNEISVLIDLIF